MLAKKRRALELLREGTTKKEIAILVGVSLPRIVQWKQTDKEFREEWNKIMASLGRIYS